MEISKEEFAYFSEILAQKFELNQHKKIDADLGDLEKILGLPLLIQTKTDDVNRIKLKNLLDNQIVFYAKTKKSAVFYLAKHFRNCASHKGRITKKKVGDSYIFLFEDKYGGKATLRCKLSKETLILLINKLYDENKNS